MAKWQRPALVAVGCALLAAPLLAFGLPEDADDKEKAAAKQELKELQEQRAKIDDRIRAARKKAGLSEDVHGFVFGDGKLQELYGLGGEHQIIVKKALGDANKAMAEAFKQIPKFDFDFDHDGKAFRLFTDKDGKALRIFTDKDGKAHKFEGNMTEEEKKKFKESMEKMKIELRENLKGLKDLKELKELKVEIPEIRAYSGGRVITPRVITPEHRILTVPRARGGAEDRELRDEIRALRDEVQKLRDEVKRGRSSSNTQLDAFGPAI